MEVLDHGSHQHETTVPSLATILGVPALGMYAVGAPCRKVIIFNLIPNAGTYAEHIDRLCARNLPMSAWMARKLKSFGDA